MKRIPRTINEVADEIFTYCGFITAVEVTCVAVLYVDETRISPSKMIAGVKLELVHVEGFVKLPFTVTVDPKGTFGTAPELAKNK
ncbi:MAG: hypothetical protein ABSF09_07940 [Candidatus Bathyarchaeia archaeon]|jgi:hypothetical protein